MKPGTKVKWAHGTGTVVNADEAGVVVAVDIPHDESSPKPLVLADAKSVTEVKPEAKKEAK